MKLAATVVSAYVFIGVISCLTRAFTTVSVTDPETPREKLPEQRIFAANVGV